MSISCATQNPWLIIEIPLPNNELLYAEAQIPPSSRKKINLDFKTGYWTNNEHIQYETVPFTTEPDSPRYLLFNPSKARIGFSRLRKIGFSISTTEPIESKDLIALESIIDHICRTIFRNIESITYSQSYTERDSRIGFGR